MILPIRIFLLVLVLLAAGGCTRVATLAAGDGRVVSSRVHLVALPFANVYAIETDGSVVLVDAGPPGRGRVILSELERLGVETERLVAIVVTHAHRDHAGGVLELRELTDARVLAHASAARAAARGWGGQVRPNGAMALLGWPFAARHYPPWIPDERLAGGDRLDRFGLAATVVETPGHAEGSISILLDTGDAIVGDLIAGDVFDAAAPRVAFFTAATSEAEQRRGNAEAVASVKRLLAAGARRFLPGHGGPLEADSVRRWLSRAGSSHHTEDGPG